MLGCRPEAASVPTGEAGSELDHFPRVKDYTWGQTDFVDRGLRRSNKSCIVNGFGPSPPP